jgi:mono/diheme cytochrome c family protein
MKAQRFGMGTVALLVVLLANLPRAILGAEPPKRPALPEYLDRPIIPLPGTPRGNAVKGQHLFRTLGCQSCHTVDGRGGKSGPDLERVGELRTEPGWYRSYFADPRSMFPNSIKPPVRLAEDDMDDLIAYLLSLKLFR